jgi:hypothetical protein
MGAAQSLLDLEAAFAVRVEVLVPGRREPGDVLLVHGLALGPKPLDHGGRLLRASVGSTRVTIQCSRLTAAISPSTAPPMAVP